MIMMMMMMMMVMTMEEDEEDNDDGNDNNDVAFDDSLASTQTLPHHHCCWLYITWELDYVSGTSIWRARLIVSIQVDDEDAIDALLIYLHRFSEKCVMTMKYDNETIFAAH